jgi:hypothetical protein
MNASTGLNQYLDFALGHLPLTLLITGLVFAFLALLVVRRQVTARRIVDVLLRSYLFWTIGVLFLYGAITKGAFGADVTAMLHLSPVEAAPEAAYAELAFAILALLAFIAGNIGLRFAAVLAPAIYVLAPIALHEPAAVSTLIAHAPIAAIYGLGLFYVLLQAGAGRPVAQHPMPELDDILPTT